MKHFASICHSSANLSIRLKKNNHAVKIENLMKNIYGNWHRDKRTVHQKQPKTMGKINGLLTEMLTDTGSSTSITDEGTSSKLKDSAD